MIEYTLAIIKPDAIKRHLIGKIISRLEENQFTIEEMKLQHLKIPDAQSFYHMHKEKPFFSSLCAFMTSYPVVLMVLSKENAIEELRKLMGATDPKAAAPNTIRKEFALNVEQNSIHGSDSKDSARREIAFFFLDFAETHSLVY
ncbi:MAG: nucleoside-diphosphate kinase [Candidatus Fischerbacteria bacterium RBG_13_37_8]|uniref:Nucleoside diphosphate kinase n=1 Tax=Candidatus Fischerbacteria bacterium RBG_13_37_8 TaxID=1817863 RepID=A0A1F5VUF0_9BACT|nr:MAG: nucleoside-diphosphate kinase [Candidatus Fischerbacteria bacterium RBG_13_37_8]